MEQLQQDGRAGGNPPEKIRMIGLDLDGTILTNEKKVTQRMRHALQAAAACGIVCVVVTGRPRHGIPEEIEECGAFSYYITSNGAITAASENAISSGDRSGNANVCRQEEILRSRFLRREQAEHILAILKSGSWLYNIFWDGYGYSPTDIFHRQQEMYRGTPLEHYFGQCRRPAEDIDSILQRAYDKTAGIENIWIAAGDALRRCQMEEQIRSLYPELLFADSGTGNFEIGAPEADKGMAFLDLTAHLGISREQTLAIGDGANDLGLLRAAGVSVAMKNASDEVKRACRYVTEDNEHDGAAICIEKILKTMNKAEVLQQSGTGADTNR